MAAATPFVTTITTFTRNALVVCDVLTEVKRCPAGNSVCGLQPLPCGQYPGRGLLGHCLLRTPHSMCHVPVHMHRQRCCMNQPEGPGSKGRG
ncbi:hypothetical protein HaLaN_16778 [Haematococcus lacustris]|uniref:Uncharacterized protein n=1 Tax=Haematococcus lacustris TaxID=44745 RepID=A0A699ZJM1_HAELA|nr:hypothetical protein HaLaN_16778 [Haematococcus lacustris]